ncbi:glutamate 5-kinase [Ornithinimicrobium tianjinense]|uniref:Glutamate 5-kinase n=1 Tax=Ornithinimicrobium tianjinense TaxID=1195761 RepID=A0A917BLW2_9MICO|nr:glutamate 5-kinase [Ornithinimicrobium tianjinense]GGF49676.1 glutamate 5-kinase [Ornithinimicrobium tianjinense]
MFETTGDRRAIRDAHRLVVKVGSSSLTGPEGGLDGYRLQALATALAKKALEGTQIVLVSSGAIAAGMAPLGLARRPKDLATQQAAASAGQGLLMTAYTQAFTMHGVRVGQVLLTADDMHRRSHYVNASRTLERLLELEVVPVVNENDTVATDEIRFGDNDRLAALVAHLVDADALLLLSDVDALYDGHPRHPGSRRIPHVASPTDLEHVDVSGAGSQVGTGGMATKVAAAQMATAEGVTVLLTSADQIVAALAGDAVGTLFTATGSKSPARRRWLAHASSSSGRLVLDDGAVQAVVRRRTSLLPVGITRLEGRFAAGDTVELCDGEGRVVARGLVGYDSAELAPLVGHRLERPARLRTGEPAPRPVVRRDDLVVL